MDQNVGTLDRLGRIAVALAIIFVLVRSGKVNLLNAVLLITSGALISSAASGSCALYTHLGISTSEKL
ncbi:MAG: hypothetical protein BWZ01_02154 [Deltaproteobacteria bacterium ADurb.BinA179]|jgi:hypothetical protein|nr:MAG: hypothetical protein BWZ01_02154 [Deltaproteobacteria bacterium ADurb.BinA179]HNU75588.1 DUF2892 domain-containing protein [Deltaproteobacteria bacterium]HOD69651.1 DUF2892 domain-containing protein [Deltaproteobacteria bacterium]HON61286.1 DUF2892 domain-containing protein [Deltaproteobacteria bacterium]HPV28355.1 DUF2892 domain-containing protein [Deltaproteobacteria bacterium]